MGKIQLATVFLVAVLALSLIERGPMALAFQDIASNAFQGQDIMGGAAVIFKRPQRLRDLVGGASLAVVKKSKPRHVEPAEIATNNSNSRKPPRERPPGTEPTVKPLSDADKAEAFKNQGNTYYGLGQYDKAVDAYHNALKYDVKDSDTHNNLGATYLSLGRNVEASQSFRKAIDLKPDDPEAYFN